MPLSIRDIPFFKGLSAKELSVLKDCLREKSFDRGQAIHLEGSICERVFFVKSGRVKLYRLGSSGREQILETLEPGDTCACNPGDADWQCPSTAEAVVPATVWFVLRDKYSQLVLSNPLLTRALNRLFADRLRCYSSLIEEVSLKDSKKRLIKFLLDMLQVKPPDGGRELVLPFTREELAQRLGLARETVARQLYELKRLKLIDIHERRISILDEKGLSRRLS